MKLFFTQQVGKMTNILNFIDFFQNFFFPGKLFRIFFKFSFFSFLLLEFSLSWSVILMIQVQNVITRVPSPHVNTNGFFDLDIPWLGEPWIIMHLLVPIPPGKDWFQFYFSRKNFKNITCKIFCNQQRFSPDMERRSTWNWKCRIPIKQFISNWRK